MHVQSENICFFINYSFFFKNIKNSRVTSIHVIFTYFIPKISGNKQYSGNMHWVTVRYMLSTGFNSVLALNQIITTLRVSVIYNAH